MIGKAEDKDWETDTGRDRSGAFAQKLVDDQNNSLYYGDKHARLGPNGKQLLGSTAALTGLTTC